MSTWLLSGKANPAPSTEALTLSPAQFLLCACHKAAEGERQPASAHWCVIRASSSWLTFSDLHFSLQEGEQVLQRAVLPHHSALQVGGALPRVRTHAHTRMSAHSTGNVYSLALSVESWLNKSLTPRLERAIPILSCCLH